MMAGKGREYGLILCPTSPMFTNANGKRKCRKMRRPAGIPIMRRKIAFSAPVSCVLAESSSCSFSALLRQECAFLRHVLLPFLPSFSRPSLSLFFILFPSFRSFSFLSFFLLSAFFHLLVFFFFLFSGRREIRHSVCGRERMKKER